MPRISANNKVIHYNDTGVGDLSRGENILLIHGSVGSAKQWQAVATNLSKEHRVLTVDLPGHGRSNPCPGQSIADYCADIKALVDTLGLQPLIMVGHSMGGAIALEYAINHGQDLLALGLLSTGAKLKVSPYLFEICEENNLQKMKTFTAKYCFSPIHSLVKVQRWQEDWGFPNIDVIHKDFLACNSFDRMNDLGSINGIPTLIICGKDDQMTPLKYSKYMLNNIGTAKLEVIPKTAHMTMIENAEQVSQLIANLIDDCQGIEELAQQSNG